MSRTRYTVACLSLHGVGPELMAQASRGVEAASALHGFTVDQEHVPYGAEAMMRLGHPYPASSHRAVHSANAVLVAPGNGEPLDAVEAELDLRASVDRIRFGGSRELTVVAPLDPEGWGFALRCAFETAAASRARVTVVGLEGAAAAWASAAADRHTGFEVERLGATDAVRSLVSSPERFDVVVCPPELAPTFAELGACEACDRVAAWGRLAGTGPSLFGASQDGGHDAAGQDVSDPSSMLLAAALMLAEGLGERRAGATLARAVGRAGGVDERASTRERADAVLDRLPHVLELEFQREAV
jgi:isocitrate/isopropylmalate dehydrogenase